MTSRLIFNFDTEPKDVPLKPCRHYKNYKGIRKPKGACCAACWNKYYFEQFKKGSNET